MSSCNFAEIGPRHRSLSPKHIRCSECRSFETYIRYKSGRKASPNWHFTWDPDSTLCGKCHNFYLNKVKKWTGYRNWYNSRRVFWHGIRTVMDRNFRTGTCSECKSSERKTGIYNFEKTPLYNWRELCFSCASKLKLIGRAAKKAPVKNFKSEADIV
jgi:hypothetical protein